MIPARPETFQAGRALDLEVELCSRKSIIASLIDHIRSSDVGIHDRLIRCINLTVAVEVRRSKERAAGEETGPVACAIPQPIKSGRAGSVNRPVPLKTPKKNRRIKRNLL